MCIICITFLDLGKNLLSYFNNLFKIGNCRKYDVSKLNYRDQRIQTAYILISKYRKYIPFN